MTRLGATGVYEAIKRDLMPLLVGPCEPLPARLERLRPSEIGRHAPKMASGVGTYYRDPSTGIVIHEVLPGKALTLQVHHGDAFQTGVDLVSLLRGNRKAHFCRTENDGWSSRFIFRDGGHEFSLCVTCGAGIPFLYVNFDRKGAQA